MGGGESMEPSRGLHNTNVGVIGCMGVKRRGGWVGELKRRGLAVGIQNPYRERLSNRLPATSTRFRLCISLGLTHTQPRLKLVDTDPIHHCAALIQPGPPQMCCSVTWAQDYNASVLSV